MQCILYAKRSPQRRAWLLLIADLILAATLTERPINFMLSENMQVQNTLIDAVLLKSGVWLETNKTFVFDDRFSFSLSEN